MALPRWPDMQWSSSVRLLTLSLLYFVQGAPYGFQTACLPIVLREHGLSFTALGAMKLLFLPWVCKPLYAPVIERTRSKDWWLTLSMLLLGCTCLAAAVLTSPQQVWTLSALMLALNLFSAAQDVATDSLAVRVLGPHELGVGNTIQVVAYKAGSVFAGGMLLWVRDAAGWAAMFAAFAALYFVAVALFRHYKLASEAVTHAKSEEAHDDPHRPFSWAEVLSVPGTAYLLFFVAFYKLCERAEQTFSLYLVDKGVPSSQLALWSTVVRSASLLGSAYGGNVLSFGKAGDDAAVGGVAKGVLVKYSALRTMPIAGQLAVMSVWGPDKSPKGAFDSVYTYDSAMTYAGLSCTCVALFCAGVITTSAFTLMMRLSQKAPLGMQGTHYTLLATFEVLGKLTFASLSGWLMDRVGLWPCFVSFVVLAILCVPASRFLPNAVTNSKARKNN